MCNEKHAISIVKVIPEYRTDFRLPFIIKKLWKQIQEYLFFKSQPDLGEVPSLNEVAGYVPGSFAMYGSR